MIPIICSTNLDIREKWPDELPARPNVGDLIRSKIKWKNKYTVELEVVRCTWGWIDCNFNTTSGWYLKVELHLPKGRFESLYAFGKWYEEISGNPII